MIIIILLIRSGIVFSKFQTVDFQKNYTDADDLPVESMFSRIQDIHDWWSGLSLFSSGEKVLETPMTPHTINDAIKDTITTNNQSYMSSNTMSFDDIIASISTDSLNSSITSTKELEEQYQNTQDPTIAIALITKLSKEYNYARAYEIFQELDSTTIKTMNPHVIMRILLNSNLVNQQTQDLNTIDNMIVELSTNNILQAKDAQRYKTILMLLKGDKI